MNQIIHPSAGANRVIGLISPDAALFQTLRTALTGASAVLQGSEKPIEAYDHFNEMDGVGLVIADIDATRREDLLALQKLMIKLGGNAPVIVLTEAFDDQVGRWFLQIRVSDFLRKPVKQEDLLRACFKAMRLEGGQGATAAQVVSFIPAAGGVGNTTLAVEAAMQFAQSGAPGSTCLVDLDFHNDACAGFLDLDPRLDLREIGPHGERFDPQLMEVMLSRHASGLMLLAAPGRPVEPCEASIETVIRLLDVLAARFDHLVIDMPRSWYPWTDDALAGSDKIFVVTDMTVPGLRCGRRLAGRIRERLPASVCPKVIVNRFQTGTIFGGGLRRADVERALGASFAGPVANNYQLVREALDRGVPLETVKAGNNVSADLKKILFAQAA